MAFISTDDPTTYQEAESYEDVADWMEAIEDEFMAQVLNNTWKIVKRPIDRKIIGKRMVFRSKKITCQQARKKRAL